MSQVNAWNGQTFTVNFDSPSWEWKPIFCPLFKTKTLIKPIWKDKCWTTDTLIFFYKIHTSYVYSYVQTSKFLLIEIYVIKTILSIKALLSIGKLIQTNVNSDSLMRINVFNFDWSSKKNGRFKWRRKGGKKRKQRTGFHLDYRIMLWLLLIYLEISRELIFYGQPTSVYCY